VLPARRIAGRTLFLAIVLAWAQTMPTLGVRASDPPSELTLAQRKIKHVIFILKENRSFDSMFGAFPGADGAASGQICGTSGLTTGTVPLKPAPDQAADIDHSFLAGVSAINGGMMNCFNRLAHGRFPGFRGYVRYSSTSIPAYWAYAHHFTLADHFFSSVYGPTGVEQLWSFAASSGRFVGHEGNGSVRHGAAARVLRRPCRTRRVVHSVERCSADQDQQPGVEHHDCFEDPELLDPTLALHRHQGAAR
jgi:phospholipase C